MLGLDEGWMAIFDEDMSKPWDEKIYSRDVELGGKQLLFSTIYLSAESCVV